MNRRSFLQRLGIAAAIGATGSALATPRPTRQQLERYYALLWREHHALAKELGIDMFEHDIVLDAGHREATSAALVGPPSSRAIALLTAAGCA
ncbi:twin-arginine translocation signal domain-containing protein [Aureimonas flava]|nr:twin-arginine translocation signal domain-containing protein [Aureimonas flava]